MAQILEEKTLCQLETGNVSITLYSNSFNREDLIFEDQAKYMKEQL